MNEFIQANWLYLAIGAAVLFFYEVEGKPLFAYLLDKVKGDPKPQPQVQVQQVQQPQYVEQGMPSSYEVTTKLSGQEFGKFTIQKEPAEK
jgi:hypothetical protein